MEPPPDSAIRGAKSLRMLKLQGGTGCLCLGASVHGVASVRGPSRVGWGASVLQARLNRLTKTAGGRQAHNTTLHARQARKSTHAHALIPTPSPDGQVALRAHAAGRGEKRCYVAAASSMCAVAHRRCPPLPPAHQTC